jgi:molybdopterin molybdotransferase
MVSFEEARRLVLENVTLTDVETVPLLEASGRVLAEELMAPFDMPPWDTSAMDGFGVFANASPKGAELPVRGYLPAGAVAASVKLQPGTAVRIMTGAQIPEGCDAVVAIEETADLGELIRIEEAVEPGRHVRKKGGDIPAGIAAIPVGTQIRPQEINLLASYSRLMVPVYRRVRVAILSTGDELIEPNEELTPGKVVNSNQFSLACSVLEAGGEPLMLGIARDNRESLLEKLALGLKADILVTSAGVSAGDRDFVRECLQELGVRQIFWKVAMKPGGPTAFGMYGRVPVFSLPGNPVSTMVTFEQFVRPAMLTMMGLEKVLCRCSQAVLTNDIHKQPGKLHFVRVSLQSEGGRLYASSTGVQHTYNLRTMLCADALAIIPAESTELKAGQSVQVQLLGELREPARKS